MSVSSGSASSLNKRTANVLDSGNSLSELTESSIGELVDRFYACVREDDQIGPIFNNTVESWDAHLSLLKDFWCTVLFAQRRYKGNPLLAHFHLPIEDRFFDRWLDLFSETAAEILTPNGAAIGWPSDTNRDEYETGVEPLNER